MKWIISGVVLLAFILLPFALFGARIEGFTHALLAEGQGALIPVLVVAALALDVFLPVPSSMVGAIAGAMLGLIPGALAIWVGLCLGCVLAFGAGRRLGAPILDRMVGAGARRAAGQRVRMRAALYLGLMRAVPVLAEASVLSAGALSLPFGRFMLVTSIANAPIALIYAAAGSYAFQAGVFWPAFGAVAVTLAIYLAVATLVARRS